MNITLKNIKVYQSMSEETLCFEASLWVDQKKLCRVTNSGRGGCNDYSCNFKDIEKVDAWCKANLPRWGGSEDTSLPVPCDGYETSLDVHLGDLLNEHIAIKDLKKYLKSRVVLVPKNGGVSGEFSVIKHPNYSSGSKARVEDLGSWFAKVERDNPSDLVISRYNDDARDAWLKFCRSTK